MPETSPRSADLQTLAEAAAALHVVSDEIENATEVPGAKLAVSSNRDKCLVFTRTFRASELAGYRWHSLVHQYDMDHFRAHISTLPASLDTLVNYEIKSNEDLSQFYKLRDKLVETLRKLSLNIPLFVASYPDDLAAKVQADA